MESKDEENNSENSIDNENNQEMKENKESEENNISEEISKININKEESNINIIKKNKINQDDETLNEKISLINIDIEKEKNNQIYINKQENNENKNEIKILKNIDKEDEDWEKDDKEENELNNYLFKCNKEYTDDDNDLHSRRITARNNEDYLIKQEDSDDKEKDILGEYKNDNEEENEEEKLFPFKIVGDGKKKGESLGYYNSRYFEIDSIKGLFKRYTSSKEYPKNPKEIIEIKNLKLIKKQRLTKEYHDFEIIYLAQNSKGKKFEKKENYRFRHQECRNKWFDSLLTLWQCYVNNTPMPKITKENLCFVDDRLGIIQEIGRGNKQAKSEKKKQIKMDLNKFKILKLLGVGGFGTVFKVRHILTGKIYAMKVMNKNYIIKKKYLHYVVSEFKIMKLLSGFPFILDLHYCFQSANFLYLIIDYCPNGDFTNLENINNPKLFFAEVLLAFEYLHNKTVIYRDLKPDNILLDESGHIKLCDFNLAKSGMTKNKRANSFCGSPLYFSPEMVMAKGANYKCDIYGIGLLMYEIITGCMAYNANNIKELYDKIKKNKINFNHPNLQGDIKDLIMRMCAKEPEDRIEIEDIKKHKYFHDIDFDKVLRKEYGNIITKKKNLKKKKENEIIDENKKEDIEYKKFMEQQKIIDEDKSLNILNGKITLKEMKLDQSKPMKNKVREFYYVKKEDIDKAQEFKLEIKGDNEDISSLIIEQYDA